jgi:GNAT superfamily N-acetyltransferase
MIRLATEEDIFDLLVLTKNFMKEAGEFFKFNKDKIETFLSMAIPSDDHCVIVCEVEGSVVGFLICQCADNPFVDRKLAFEIGWYMSKEHRGARNSIRLLKAFEEWAISKGVDCLILADIPKLTDLADLYGKLGYFLSERSFVKVL